MKTLHKIKLQKASMFLSLALRRINGEISREEHRERCDRVHFAYANVCRNILNKNQ